MDGNKDEALRCIKIAEEAIASGNKQRAMKFIGIAQRLNRDFSVEDLLSACEKLDSGSSTPPIVDETRVNQKKNESRPSENGRVSNGEPSYSEEHVRLIREVKRNKDYYEILGVEKSCSVEELRKAYRKLSLKVHPDKNKAPGSEEAFKKVCKAFKCLSDENTRRQYDHVGPVEESEYIQPNNFRRRRRRNGNDFFDDDFDPDEIFRSFFGQTDMFRTTHVYRTRETSSQQRQDFRGGPNLMVLLQLIPFLAIILLAYLPFSEPEYSLHKTDAYHIPKMTEKIGVEFYVKSSEFDKKFPLGSNARANMEDTIVRDYIHMLRRYCQIELQRRQWSRNLPIPHCDKLRKLEVA